MACSPDSDTIDAGVARKVLRLLDALRQSQSGTIVYRQVERMLDELVRTNREIQLSYAMLATSLLDAYAAHLEPGSELQVQVKLLQARLQPPLSHSDLQPLRDYVEACSERIAQVPDLDQAVLAEAIGPLLRAFGIQGTDSARRTAAVPEPTDAAQTVGLLGLAGQTESGAPPLAGSGLATEAATSPAEALPIGRLGGQPTLKREPEQPEPEDIADAENAGDRSYRSQLDARRRDIQELQAGLAQQVLDTIAQNQEFGVLLEVVLGELREAGEISELENLRWTLIREIEKLMSGHHELADKLDSTQHYLQVIESDSRQLTDELTRVRLLSLTDELTGLPNRRAFLRRLEDEVARVQRYGFPLTLALIDLDKFKEINDKYGHAGGDEVLRVYSKNILSIFRHHDLVARYGGEEFAVLLPNTEREGALRALTKVKNRCMETRWQSNGTIVSAPTFSAGLALYKPGETSTAFVERVDKALYRAKRLGRNRVELDMTYQSEGETREPAQQGAEPN